MNTAIKSETLINQLNWRYATKQHFDPTKKISDADYGPRFELALQLDAVERRLAAVEIHHRYRPAVPRKTFAASYGQAQTHRRFTSGRVRREK